MRRGLSNDNRFLDGIGEVQDNGHTGVLHPHDRTKLHHQQGGSWKEGIVDSKDGLSVLQTLRSFSRDKQSKHLPI